MEVYRNEKIPGRTFFRVDLYCDLKNILGEQVCASHKYLWQIVSGDGLTSDEYRHLVLSYYDRFNSFANFIDDLAYFGDKSKSLHERLNQALTEVIDKRRKIVLDSGYKILGEDSGYMYLATIDASSINVEGVTDIYA